MIRVFLLDDHELVRRGIVDVIEREADLTVVGEAGTVREAVSRVDATAPDVAVLDVRLPDGSGIDACRDIRSAHPGLPCIMLTAFDDDEAQQGAVLAGAQGWLLKDIRGAGLVSAIRQVAAGAQLMDAELVRRARQRVLDRRPADDVQLTLREHLVLTLITEGMTNRQIGEQLGLAEKTVKNYVSGLLGKIGVERRTQAAVYGLTHPHSARP
jgi:two-component system response regulator DevR